MKLNNTVLKCFKIIELLSKNVDGLTLSEIATYLNIPTSSTYDILLSLLHIDAIVIKNVRLKTYAIGSKMYVYGSTYTKSSNLLNFASKYLIEFSDKYNLTTFIYKNNSSPVIVYKYQSSNAKIITNDVGDSIDCNKTAVWKIYDAFGNDKNIENIVSSNISFDIGVSESHCASVACCVFDKINSKSISGVIGFTTINDKSVDYNLLADEFREISNKITLKLMEVE